MDVEEALALLSAPPSRAGIFTDFDGTLSEIVDAPDAAVATDSAAETLSALARRFAVVAVVSGRSLDDLRTRLDVDGVLLAGSYGRERSDRRGGRRPTEGWETVAAAAAAMIEDLPGVALERKGAGVALHYRAAPTLEDEVRQRADVLAREFELDLFPGRLVAELVQPGPGKADAIVDSPRCSSRGTTSPISRRSSGPRRPTSRAFSLPLPRKRRRRGLRRRPTSLSRVRPSWWRC